MRPTAVQKGTAALLLASLALAAWRFAAGPWIPYVVTSDVTETLVAWREAGIRCNDFAEVGWPGPAASWGCHVPGGPNDLRAALEADSAGIMSIGFSATAGTDRSAAARAFVRVLEATPILGVDREQIAGWLIDRNAADGTMLGLPTEAVGRVSVDTSGEGRVVVRVTPAGSTSCLATLTGTC